VYPSTGMIALISKRLWPTRHNLGLAQALGVPTVTARSWIRGKRRMPEKRLRQLEAFLLQLDEPIVDLAWQCDFHARQEARRIKPRTGFWLLRDWYGTGIISNKRWHWPPRHSAASRRS